MPAKLATALTLWPKSPAATQTVAGISPAEAVSLVVPASLKRRGIGKQMIIPGQTANAPDQSLIKPLIKAHDLRNALLSGQGTTPECIAGRQGINSSYATRLLRLSFLAPEIVKMILDGRQPATLTARGLVADTRLPIAWSKQLAALTLSPSRSQPPKWPERSSGLHLFWRDT